VFRSTVCDESGPKSDIDLLVDVEPLPRGGSVFLKDSRPDEVCSATSTVRVGLDNERDRARAGARRTAGTAEPSNSSAGGSLCGHNPGLAFLFTQRSLQGYSLATLQLQQAGQTKPSRLVSGWADDASPSSDRQLLSSWVPLGEVVAIASRAKIRTSLSSTTTSASISKVVHKELPHLRVATAAPPEPHQ